MVDKSALRAPDDFCDEHGWCRANNYGLAIGEGAEGLQYHKAKFKRACAVERLWNKTDARRELGRQISKEAWEVRAAKAKRTSDTTEVLLLEELTKREDGVTASELVARCISMIAKELSIRGLDNIKSLELKDLVLISNTLIGLTKAAAATKKDQDWKPQVQVNNLTVNNSSKTGGVVGGLKDVIDIRAKDDSAR